MRVVHVISGLNPVAGGPTTALAGFAKSQRAAGLDVAVASTHTQDANREVAEHLSAQGVDVHMIGPVRGPLAHHRQIAPRLERLIGNADIVHIHALWEQIQHCAARIASRRAMPYLFSPHGMLDPWSLAQKWLKKYLYMLWRLRADLNQATAIHCTTGTERDLIQRLRLRSEVFVEPLGIDLTEFEPLPEPGHFRASYPQIRQRPIVLFLSRIHYKKGLDLLIPAFAQAQIGDAILVIAGPDSEGYQKTVEQMIASHAIEDRVIFTGMLYGAQRIQALVDAELMVLPSYQENFGVVVVEALASGTPVIISDQVNLQREIAPAKVGAVVPPQVDALAEQLTRWLGDPHMRTAAAGRARALVRENYDWLKIGHRWVDHYARYRIQKP